MGSPKKRLAYTYDSRGNRRSLVDPDGGRFTYSHDAVNRITQVINPQGERTSYSYDAASRRTLKRMANGTRASFTYDAASNLATLCDLRGNGTVISRFDYAYDKVGNRTRVVEADGSRVTWSYDATYQLTGEHRTSISSELSWDSMTADDWDQFTADEWAGLPAMSGYQDAYGYDPAGNRLLKVHDGARTTSSYDAANQLRWIQDASGRTTYTFDADGNQRVVRRPNGVRTTYTWDSDNRLTMARMADETRNTMAYDPDGARMSLDAPGGVKKFVWDQQSYLSETNSSNDTQVLYTSVPAAYGGLVSERRGGTSSWFHFDAIGSTRALTNSSSTVTDIRVFDAWGGVNQSTGSSTSPLMYIGEFGYYTGGSLDLGAYVRARYLATELGQWRSVDPRWASPEERYAYASNAPVVFIDPSGLKIVTVDIVVKSFIEGVPLIGTITPPNRLGLKNQLPPEWIKLAANDPSARVANATERLTVLRNAVLSLPAFKQNPQTDKKDQTYRLYSRVKAKFECCSDNHIALVNAEQDFDGGDEVPPIRGTMEVSKLAQTRESDTCYLLEWQGFGRPNALVEPGMQWVATRTSVYIWHEPRVQVCCNGGKLVSKLVRFTHSGFPSHKVWIDSKNVEHTVQRGLAELWNPLPSNPAFVTE